MENCVRCGSVTEKSKVSPISLCEACDKEPVSAVEEQSQTPLENSESKSAEEDFVTPVYTKLRKSDANVPPVLDDQKKVSASAVKMSTGLSRNGTISSDADRVKTRAELAARSFGFKSLSPMPSPTNSDSEEHIKISSRSKRLRQLDEEPASRKLATSKRFKDQVYGHIELPAVCIAVMDTPQFQRLRNLKQLGAAYFVYPGASHNRFEHSIGVSWLAGVLMKRLREVQPQFKITDRDVEVVQLAGLVHDLGHGPYSHMFDGQFIPRTRPDLANYCHEQMTVKLFDLLLQENQIDLSLYGLETESDVIFIRECILGEKLPGGIRNRKGRPREKAFMYDVISNVESGMDVDRLDYFERDARNTSVKSGCDVQRLIAESRVVDVVDHPRIVFPDKLVGDVLAAYQTRFRLHNVVYQHKVVKAIELMIVDALIAADRAGVFSFRGSDKRDYSLSRCVDDPIAFCLAQDDVLQQIRASRSIEALGARTLIKRLDTRQLYRSVGEVSIRRPSYFHTTEPLSAGGSELLIEEAENNNTLTQIETQNTELYQLYDQSEEVIKKLLLETHSAKQIELSESDVIVEKMRVHHGSYAADPVQSVYFYSKSDPTRARKLAKTKYENLCPATFMKEAIRVFCTSTSPNVIRMVHEAFKELTKTKPFLSAKGTPLNGPGGSPWNEHDEADYSGEEEEEDGDFTLG